MPVKLNAHLASDNAEARIEIVPLIDIMFFLLASFMLVDISVNRAGQIFLDKEKIGRARLAQALADRRHADPTIRVMISGDREALHGDIIAVLDAARSAGIDKVAFDISSQPSEEKP